jgi:hypothetical protein
MLPSKRHFFEVYFVLLPLLEVHRMREKTFHVYVDSHDRSLLLQSLVELKNLLLQQGRYTDCVDELIFKVINAPIKKFKIDRH